MQRNLWNFDILSYSNTLMFLLEYKLEYLFMLVYQEFQVQFSIWYLSFEVGCRMDVKITYKFGFLTR